MTRLEQLAKDRYLCTFLEQLNEAQARWFVAREALLIGDGGVSLMHEATCMSKPTISRGIREMEEADSNEILFGHRVRLPGGGRKPLEEEAPGLRDAIEKIMIENAAGEAISPLYWTQKSTRSIAEELAQQGHSISASTVLRRLRKMGYSLQAKRTDMGKGIIRERDEQFRHITGQVEDCIGKGVPVVFVDCMKKEYGGHNKNDKRHRHKSTVSTEVSTDALSNDTLNPDNSHDIGKGKGFVNVGISSETAEIAAENIQRWWKLLGRLQFPKSESLLICAGCAGKNVSDLSGWKHHLQGFADKFNLSVRVSHLPPGTIKWNWIEHQTSSLINIGCQSQTLVDYKVVVSLIGDVRATPDLHTKVKNERKKAPKLTKGQVSSINIVPSKFQSDRNYTITSQKKLTDKRHE